MKKFAYVLVFLAVFTLALTLVACDKPSSQTEPPVQSQTVEGMDDFNYYAKDKTVLLLSPKNPNSKSITIPASVTSISEGAFDGCTNLEEVKFAQNSKLAEIKWCAFRGCASLKSIDLPSSVSKIESRAFFGCTSLEKVSYDQSKIKSFGSAAFEDCKMLKSVVIPSSVSEVTSKDFVGCDSLAEVVFSDGVKRIGNDAFNGKSLERIVLSQTLQSIGDRAFKDNKLSGAILFPKSLTSIGNEAFFGNAFDEITILDGVTSIGKDAFVGGEKAALKTLCVPFAGLSIDNGTLEDVFSVKAVANLSKLTILSGKITKETMQNLATVTLEIGQDVRLESDFISDTAWYQNQPDGIVYLGNIACGFKGDSSRVKKLTFKEGTTRILDEAFSLNAIRPVSPISVIIPSTLTNIGENAFFGTFIASFWVSQNNPAYKSSDKCLLSYDEKSLILGSSFGIIPSGVETIESGAFSIGLNQVGADVTLTIPQRVTTIKDNAFLMGIANLYFEEGSKLTTIGNNAFAQYGNTTNEKVLDLSMLESLTYIGDYAFGRFLPTDKIETVKLPKGVRSIGACAFGGGLKNIEFSSENKNYTLIDNCLIKGSTVVLGTSNSRIPAKYTDDKGNEIDITEIGDYAFSGVDVTGVSLPATIAKIGNSAFQESRGLASVTIPSSVTSIGKDAFSGSTLSEVVFGEDSQLTQIGENAFGKTQLTKITIPSRVATIENGAFAGVNLTEITFQTRKENDCQAYDLQNIGDTAFDKSLSLKRLVAPAGVIAKIKGSVADVQNVEIVGEDVEAGLLADMKVSDLTIGEGVKKIGDRAFEGLQITSLTIPASVREIGVGAFWHCPIKTLVVADGNATFIFKNNCLIDKTTHTLVAAFDNGTISKDFVWGGSDEKTKIFDVTSVGKGAFAYTQAESMTIPSNVKTIGEFAFAHSALKQVIIESGVKNIGAKAFYMAENLQTVSVADSVQSIGRSAFAHTKYYADKENENGILYIGKVAYEYRGDKSGVIGLEIKDGTVGIATHAFLRLYNLKKLTLPSSLKHIDKEAFAGCTRLKEIYFKGSDKEWDSVKRELSWDLGVAARKVYTLCKCADKAHDHDGDGVVKGDNETADVCDAFKPYGNEICDACIIKNFDR